MSILGKCDMVLAISESTINYQFQHLYQRKIIRQNWNIIIFDDEKQKPKINQTDEDFKADIDKEEFALAFNAKINAPKISILKNERKVLNFAIQFSGGKMYNWIGHGRSSKLKETEMKDWQYTFKVQIGSIEKDTKNTGSWITEESKAHFEQICKDIGLPQELFTMESLFLDFENANYADYNQSESRFPSSIIDLTDFQNLLSNYFKTLIKMDNPYILGYGIKLKKIKGQEKALFQPTALKYSTSYDDNAALRAFNFLMMADGRDFPADQDVGVLPKSLISKDSPEVDGVLGIDFALFNDKLLNPIVDDLTVFINDIFKDKTGKDGSSIIIANTNVSVEFVGQNKTVEFKKENGSLLFKPKENLQLLVVKSSSNPWMSSSCTMLITFEPNIKVNNDLKINLYLYTDIGYHHYAGYFNNRVGGNSNRENPAGCVISLVSGADGKLDCNIDTLKEIIKYDTIGTKVHIKDGGVFKDDAVNKSGNDELEKLLKEMGNSEYALFQKIANFLKDKIESATVKTKLEKLLKRFSVIILPLSKVYSYKNINISSDFNQILVDTSYTPFKD